MEKSRLNAYLNLIKKLLTCPHGEEWIYLKQHEDLVDAEFLQFMEQVAIQIGREGNSPEERLRHRTAATFLHNWAAKLHHILLKEIKPLKPEEDKSEAYLELIDQLLTYPENMQEQLLIAHETLIGPGLVQALRNVSKQLRQRHEHEAAEYLESIATDLSQAWLEDYDISSPLLKQPAISASRPPAPYAYSYGVADGMADGMADNTAEASVSPTAPTPGSTLSPQSVATAQTMDPLNDENDETDDLWFSPPKTAPLPTTLPSMTPTADQPPLSQPEPIPTSQNGFSTHLPTPGNIPTPNDTVGAVAESSETASLALGTSEGAQAITDGLNAIAQALQQLNQTLSTQTSSAETQHPLQHLELLEQACQAEWQLTTEEIEQLLGVKPKCHGHDTTYHRGEWCFTKIGKLGNQTAWRVSKAVA